MQEFKGFTFKRPTFLGKPNYKSIGYIRQSSPYLEKDNQVIALLEKGCSMIFYEAPDSIQSINDLPKLRAAISCLEPGDELVLTKLDCLGRMKSELFSLIYDLHSQDKYLRTLDGFISTRLLGKDVLPLLELLAGFYKSHLPTESSKPSSQNRSKGLTQAGRPKTSKEKAGLIIRLREEGCSYRSIRAQTGLALSTIRRIIVERNSLEV